jgi:hypothetical protein
MIATSGQIPTNPPFETAFRGQGQHLGEKFGKEVVEWLITIFEDPNWRSAAAARAAECLQDYLTAVSESARSLLNKYRTDHEELRQPVTEHEWNKHGSRNWFGIGRRQIEGEIRPIFREFCWLRFKELVLDNILGALKAVSHAIFQFD